MHFGTIAHLLAALVIAIGVCMLWPLGWALWDGSDDIAALGLSAGITIGVGLAALLATRRYRHREIQPRAGFVIVTLAWILAALFGALPFWIHGGGGQFTGPIDAIFESMSGFSTTGASILTNIEALPRGLLFWRSLTHWLGGMGIIVLVLAILPLLGVGGMQLFRAEVPGPVADKLKPRIRETAKTLWLVYVGISAVETMLLMFGGMDLFDALCHTFGTMATGGFSTRNASIGAFNGYTQWVITLFMLLAGMNFALHYLALRGRLSAYWKDEEWRTFAGIFVLFALAVTIGLLVGGRYEQLGEAARHAAFQVASIVTTTGYATSDFEGWIVFGGVPTFLLFVLMFVGGSAGSTGGGPKVMRLMLAVKHSFRELFRLVHPRAVVQVRFNDRVVQGSVLDAVLAFLVLYLTLFALGAVGFALCGLDMITSITASIATIGNIGPGLGDIGPADNYAGLPAAAKGLSMVLMLFGRLEVYTVFVLLTPTFYRR